MSTLPSLRQFSQEIIKKALAAIAAQNIHFLLVDATCGNGQDTLFLAQSLEELSDNDALSRSAILAFDVQKIAIERTRQRLKAARVTTPVHYIQEGHEHLAKYLDQLGQEENSLNKQLAIAIYNLGWLPASDRQYITHPATTLASLQVALENLLPEGIIIVHAYGGHAGGLEELRAVEEWFCTLPFTNYRVGRYELCNKEQNPEVLFVAEKV